MAAVPIWRDYIIRYNTTADYLLYSIICDGDTIFTGKAYKRPGDTSVVLKINDVCAPYLSVDRLNFGDNDFELSNTVKRTFEVLSASGEQIDSVDFYMDWSFEPGYDVITVGASVPITGEAAPGQYVVASFYDAEQVKAVVKEGSTSDDITLWSGAKTSGTGIINLRNYSKADFVSIGRYEYRIIDGCFRYVLYYVNAFGGWDSLLIKGMAKETDNYTRSTYKQTYDNDFTVARGTVNYQNDYEKSISLVTGWMTDDESLRMHHLLGSTNVYLHDLTTQNIYPVTIEDKSCEYKTYRTQGNRLVNYTLKITIAQDFVRR